MENAYRDKLDHKMPVDLCSKIINESTAEKKNALEALEMLAEGRQAYYEAGYAIQELAMNAEAIYRSPKAELEDRRLLLSYVFSNLTLKAQKIRPEYTLAFQFLKEWVPLVNQIFEPEKSVAVKGKKETFASSHPVLRAWADAFQTFEWEKAIPAPDVAL